MGRRYESMDGQNYDDLSRYEERKSGRNAVKRYEVGRQSLQSLQSSVKAKRIEVFTNGDKPKKGDKFLQQEKHQGVQITFSRKRFPQLAPLFEEITRLTKKKVTRLFKWPSGQEVCSVNEIEDECESNKYVCSNERSLVSGIAYGGIKSGGSPFMEKYSRTSHNSRGTLSSEKTSPKAPRSHASMNGGSKVPIVVTSYTQRDRTCSLFIDSRGPRDFDDILENIKEMLEVDDKIKALYSKTNPRVKVDSYSSFNMALKTGENEFWACGIEGPPQEFKSKSRDTSPMRNGYQQKQKYGNKQNGYGDNRRRQSNGYGRQADTYEDSYGRPYQRHQYEDDPEQEETDQEQTPPPAHRGGRKNDQSPQRNSKQATNRQGQRRDEDDEPPQRGSRQTANHRREEEEEEETGRRDSKRGSEQQKRQQTPPPRDDDNKRGRKDDDNGKDDDDDDDDEIHDIDKISDEEMQRRIEAMTRADSTLDRNVKY